MVYYGRLPGRIVVADQHDFRNNLFHEVDLFRCQRRTHWGYGVLLVDARQPDYVGLAFDDVKQVAAGRDALGLEIAE